MTTPVGTDGSKYRELQIVNIIASGQFGFGEIDTDTLGDELGVDQTVMTGRVYMQQRDDAPTAMVFRSGSYTIAGASSWASVLDTLEWLFETLHGVGLEVDQHAMFASVNLKYLVVTGDLDTQFSLEKAMVILGITHCEYEPEQFPALIHRPEMTDSTVLIFPTGKLWITNIKHIETGHQVYEYIEDTLEELIG